jgi:hypothetical protein
VIGVIVSGNLDDGTAGLFQVNRAVVQTFVQNRPLGDLRIYLPGMHGTHDLADQYLTRAGQGRAHSRVLDNLLLKDESREESL